MVWPSLLSVVAHLVCFVRSWLVLTNLVWVKAGLGVWISLTASHLIGSGMWRMLLLVVLNGVYDIHNGLCVITPDP